jgi:hypothetical protein
MIWHQLVLNTELGYELKTERMLTLVERSTCLYVREKSSRSAHRVQALIAYRNIYIR